MAQIPFSANLSSGFYPFLARWLSRTVIIQGKDEFYIQKTNPIATNEIANEGIAQIFFSENVMPSAEGIQSVGFLQQATGIANKVDFNDLFLLRDITENKFLFSPANGKNYVYNANFSGWNSLGGPTASLVTVAYINGLTYIFFKGVGCYQYNSTTNALDVVTLVGVTAANLNGICSSSGYLIAWDDFSVYRSQPASILDFTPDPAQGSGSSIPQDLKGSIVACLPIWGGFIIYTSKNAVAATYSQNIRYPFIYKEVQGSAGIQRPDQVSWQENIGKHYAWTQAGLQEVTKTVATNVFNAASDFLTSGVFESFNPVTLAIEETVLTGPLLVRLAVIAQTWLVVSYGIDTYTHAIIYDLIHKRWGKIKLTHASAFELILPNLKGDLSYSELDGLSWTDLGWSSWTDMGTQLQTFELPNTGLAFLGIDGTIYSLDFAIGTTSHDGVIFLGKYQYVRTRWITLCNADVETINVGANFSLSIIPSYDGKTLEAPTALMRINDADKQVASYGSDIQGLNISLLGQGTFHMTSIVMDFKLEGSF